MFNLNPLVGVGHHGNEEIDEDNGGDHHVEGKDQLELVYKAGGVPGGQAQVVVAAGGYIQQGLLDVRRLDLTLHYY